MPLLRRTGMLVLLAVFAFSVLTPAQETAPWPNSLCNSSCFLFQCSEWREDDLRHSHERPSSSTF